MNISVGSLRPLPPSDVQRKNRMLDLKNRASGRKSIRYLLCQAPPAGEALGNLISA